MALDIQLASVSCTQARHALENLRLIIAGIKKGNPNYGPMDILAQIARVREHLNRIEASLPEHDQEEHEHEHEHEPDTPSNDGVSDRFAHVAKPTKKRMIRVEAPVDDYGE